MRVARPIAGLVLLAGALSAGLSHAAVSTPGPLSTGRVARIAGSGFDFGFSGDGGPALWAQLNTPLGLAADTHGNVYIADQSNVRIRRIDAKGKITTIAGGHGYGVTGDGGRATAAGIGLPFAVAADTRGNVVLIASEQNNAHDRVRVIDSSGTIRAFAGNGTPGFSGDGGPAVNALVQHPSSLAADGQGNVYIGERQRIRKVNASGIISTLAGTGVSGFSGDGGPATAARLSEVSSLAADLLGNVYVGDSARVRRIDHATGTITTVAGTGVNGVSGDGGSATAAKITADPPALAIDRYGVLYIADIVSRRVRAVDGSGRITTIVGGKKQAPTGGWGGPGRDVALFPHGLAVDSHDGLVISDATYSELWRFTRGLTPDALGKCTRTAARQMLEQQHLGHPYDVQDTAAQVFCGPFTGRHSHAMVVSLALPSCGGSYGWVVYRSVHGAWKRVLNHNGGAYLTRSGRRILEWQGVLGPHDAHCFPSSARLRVWHWNGTRLVHTPWQRKPHVPRHLPGLGS